MYCEFIHRYDSVSPNIQQSNKIKQTNERNPIADLYRRIEMCQAIN